MEATNCLVHNFPHLSYKNVSIMEKISNYTCTWMKFTIEGQVRYGSLKSHVKISAVSCKYAFEMDEECPDGYSSKDSSVFTCKDRRGVLIDENASLCIKDNHTQLKVFPDKLINEESVCCIYPKSAFTKYTQYTIGSKFILRKILLKQFAGVCKWIGTINGEECVGAEMVQWMSNDSNGYFHRKKLFDSRPCYGVLLRCSDIDIECSIIKNPEEHIFYKNGFINLKDIYLINKMEDMKNGILRIGRRAGIIYFQDIESIFDIKLIYGTVKWMGTINKGICAGVDLDFPCDGAMNGVISCSESFECESGHGIVCPISSVTFDYYIYGVEFTVNETFNIDFEIVHIEDWNQKIVKEKDFKKDRYSFFHIEKHNRIFSEKGLLKWCGYVQGVSVGVLEMDEDFPITKQQKITEILKDVKPVSYITVATEYLFKYRTTKPYKKVRDGIEGFDIGNVTKFGTVKWQGIDGNDNLYYGFLREEPVGDGTNGTFYGQRLFECREGCGTLIPVRRLREACSFEIDSSNKSTEKANISCDVIELLKRVANDYGITSDELLITAMKMDNKGVIEPLIDSITLPINISKHTDIVNHLLQSQLFDTLQILIEKCSIETASNKQYLMVAAEALRYGKSDLFERCMNKCTNKDILMDNGETFITYIINENIDQSLIIKAIGDYEFDLTKANKSKCIPLTLACNNMMTDVMDYIMRWNKNQELSKKMCSICMDRNITTVFNCGHNSCKECSENISQCHICKEVITSRGLLYFN